MFQTFNASARPEQGPPRLAALRAVMAAEEIDIFLVPRADAHQGEYVADRDARLEWLTGFTGSAGFAAILADRAGVFIDGRYRTQVKSQVAAEFTPVPWPETALVDWLIEALPQGGVLGFDPWLHTVEEIESLSNRLTPKRFTLVALDNLVDRIWEDQPAPPAKPFTLWPAELAGESAADKLARIGALVAQAKADVAVITSPDSIAWLLNIRGRDVERNPVTQAFALVYATGKVALFAHGGKADAVAATLGDAVTLFDAEDFLTEVASSDGTVLIDRKSAPEAVLQALYAGEVEVVFGEDPCLLPKARKNPTEIAGTRAAHLRDAGAMVNFLAWLDAEAPKGELTEIAVVKALEGFRKATNQLLDISFETICGAGSDGAIVHYRVTEATDRPVRNGELLLVDSGGQYIDGTTDITRTITVGTPPAGAVDAYTRVLKGMVAIHRARFPRGVTGANLDALARYPLWLAGLDYDHGTGHGVGVYLSVHEGPQRLSRVSHIPLQEGMILSNEPGYYREGAFGIRIENLIVVRQAAPVAGGDAQRQWLDFENLTWVPFDRRLIDVTLLDQGERDWIDAYHAEIMARVTPLLDTPAQDWLAQACATL